MLLNNFILNYILKAGGSDGTRIHDPLIKSQVLYQLSYGTIINGAEKRNRTLNLLITSQLLYQLSYFGIYI